MSWRPPGTTQPVAEPVSAFDFHVAQLLDAKGGVAGHLVCLPLTYWAQAGGHLWWRRWSSPQITAEVWIDLPEDGGFREHFLFEEALDNEVSTWRRGTVVEGDQTYSLCWLDEVQADAIARSVFGIDLATERQRRYSILH